MVQVCREVPLFQQVEVLGAAELSTPTFWSLMTEYSSSARRERGDEQDQERRGVGLGPEGRVNCSEPPALGVRRSGVEWLRGAGFEAGETGRRKSPTVREIR